MNLKFGRPEGDNFYNELSQRVNQYFRQNNISRNANAEMIIKTIVVMLAYFGPYAVIFLFPMPVWLMWALCVVMGIGLAGVGMGVMHDANHNSYSSIKWVNTLLGYTLNMVGGNRNNWIIQHNVKHHTFTNVYGEDDDIENGNLIRLSPHAEWSWHHRFQHFYSWFLYMFGTITWTTAKDFRQIFRYSRDKYIKSKAEVSKELTLTIISKVVYYGYMLFLPILFLDVPFYYVLIGYITHHFTAGIILTVTFQLAHVVENNQYISKHNSDTLEDSWAVHQVKTTANFA
ncbi:MAG: fatty acid desaturase, partial [Cyclobacteriaceae bacterium]|nr:fatty acid desaturase [Cyclobacteriaceae bacterium]